MRKKRSFLAVMGLLVGTMSFAGGTAAYLSKSAGEVKNVFTAGDVYKRQKQRKKEKHLSFFFLMISKIPIIWELLSVLPTLQAHMVLSFRKDMRQGLHQQLQKLLQGL